MCIFCTTSINRINLRRFVIQNVIYYLICIALWFKCAWLMGVKMIALKIINWVSWKKLKLLYYLIQFNWVKWELNFFWFCEGLLFFFLSSSNKNEACSTIKNILIKKNVLYLKSMIATKFIETTVDLQKSLLSVAWNDMLFLIFKSFEIKHLESRRGTNDSYFQFS